MSGESVKRLSVTAPNERRRRREAEEEGGRRRDRVRDKGGRNREGDGLRSERGEGASENGESR